jgi:AmmeMemoRadiSam system protein A
VGKIISSYIFPHPPIIVPEIGKGAEDGASQTIASVKKAAEAIKNDKPTTIIVTTPHGPVFQDFVYVSAIEELVGDFGKFGGRNVKLKFKNNMELANRIIKQANKEGILSGGLEDKIFKRYKLSGELDHGVTVPLYFVNNVYHGFKLVHIAIAGLPFLELYKFGMCIGRAIADSDEQVVFLASGDLSHRLSHDAPYGFSDKGKEYDELLVKSIKELDIERLLQIDENFCESAGECGLRSFLMMFGALDGYDLKPEVYSYEGPFGVGYSVARFEAGGSNPQRLIYGKVVEENRNRLTSIRGAEDAYVKLARITLETYVREHRIIKVSEVEDLPDEMLKGRAGTFVSIKKCDQLRGCIGTIVPTRKNIAEEIIYNAISSGTRDPRFDPVEDDELDQLVYSVDVLKEPEPIKTMDELDVIKYGVIVRAGNRSGLLLPNLDGVDTPESQVSIALQKAGIRPNEKYEMERFEVIRHK